MELLILTCSVDNYKVHLQKTRLIHVLFIWIKIHQNPPTRIYKIENFPGWYTSPG